MVPLVVIIVLVGRCMSLALQHLRLPARLFSVFEGCVLLLLLLLLAMVGMEIIMIWNMGGCTVTVADRE